MVRIKIGVNNKIEDMEVEFKDITLIDLAKELDIDDKLIGAVLVDGTPKKLQDKVRNNSLIYYLPVLIGG